MAAALFAGGGLVVKRKLESFRATIQEKTLSRTGAKVSAGSVRINGLRGFRIDAFEASVEPPNGPEVALCAPTVYVDIDIIDLLHGDVTIDRVRMDNANLRFTRRLHRPWLFTNRSDRVQNDLFKLPPNGRPFRVLGHDCTLEVTNVVGTTSLRMTPFAFDIVRLEDSNELSAKLSGQLGGHRQKTVEADLRFVSLEDFFMSLESDMISAEDVNVFLPASQRVVESGVISPEIRVRGRPSGAIAISFEASFQNVAIREQQEFIRPTSGTFTAHAVYEQAEHTLRFTTARAVSDQLDGALQGSVSFAQELPSFDLELEVTRMPVNEIVAQFLGRLGDARLRGSSIDEYATIEATVEEPFKMGLTLKGSTEEYTVAPSGQAAGATVLFVPKHDKFPRADLRFERLDVRWNPETKSVEGSLNLCEGHIIHEASGFEATRVSGILNLDRHKINIEPLSARVASHCLVGYGAFDLATRQAEITVSGTLAGIENTRLGTGIRNTELSGEADFRCNASLSENLCKFDGEVDLTAAQVDYSWWFRKPSGVGARALFNGEMVPGEKMTVEADGELAETGFHATMNMVYDATRKRKWRLMSSTAYSEGIELVTVGKCLRIPYHVSGGTGTGGRYTWTRTSPRGNQWSAELECTIDELRALPDGGEFPMYCKGLDVDVTVTRGPKSTGVMTLTAESASMPPLGRAVWFVPMRARVASDSELMSKHPPVDRDWTYVLRAESIELPPWKGTTFTGEAYCTWETAGLKGYRAEIDGGLMEGTYRADRIQNLYHTTANWTNVPAVYFLDHLGYPRLLDGRISGAVDYSVDRDDPGTLRGKGQFEIVDGKLSADYVFAQLKGDPETLPPSLGFSRLSADVEFQGDLVKTPRLELASEGMQVEGKGQFVREGDMNYQIKVAIAPETAEKIPALAENFNLKGHQLAQRDIELAFRVSGPTLNPHGELEELPPPSVTLVSGALEVTSEALKVIDTPRKILLGLLRIGGGLVGATKPP